MLTRQQLVDHLKNENRFIYLGGPSRFRTQSSMLPVLGAVDAFNAYPSGARLLNLIDAINAVPAPKQMRYARALGQLYASFPRVFYIQVNPFTIDLNNCQGIGVVRSDRQPSHQVDTVSALRTLHGVIAGRQLMQAVCQSIFLGGNVNGNQVAQRRCSIKDAVGTFSGGNECMNFGSDSATNKLMVGLANGDATVAFELQAAMTNLGHPPVNNGSYTWLLGQINAMPIPNLLGQPNIVPSSTTHGMNWISELMLRNWVGSVTVFPAPLVGQQARDAVLVLGSVLYRGANNNTGISTIVHWNKANQPHGAFRPPYIGLAHELVHALHNLRGTQSGYDTNTPTGVLYEYLCVGLGAFANEPISENSVRHGFGLNARDRYG